ncbi:MAG: TolC family protein [Bacteroidia bacterium]|nr:TolC family protein [Bacteroidia bacterium]
MKNVQQILLILIGIFAFSREGKAQADSIFLDPKIEIEVILPSLDSLYEIAKLNNPTLKQEAAAMRSAQWAERYMRWIWAQNMSVFYNYSFGSLPFFAYADPTKPQDQALIQVREGYRAGINLQLSIFDVMGHRGRVNEQKEKAILQKYKRDAEAMELRRKLSLYYTDMVGYSRLYKGRNEDYLMQLVACQVAEKEYREGVIHMSEYSRQKNVLADAEAAYHESFRFFYSSLEQFEAVLGVPLHTVMIKPKKN